jgi:hypothetical protein
MTRQAEEITVFPYQIYQALSDQRIRELMAEARHHELVAIAKHSRMERTETPTRLKHAAAQLLALLHVGRDARASSRMTASAAGPMGCSA